MSNQSWSIDTSSGLPVIRDADGSPIADLWIREDTNELAVLISAAPDLLATVMEALERDPEKLKDLFGNEWFENACDAVAKAGII